MNNKFFLILLESEASKKDGMINRHPSKDKKINMSGQPTSLLPKKSSSKSLKQQMASQMSPNLQKHWNELHTEMIDDKNKMSSKQFKLPKDKTDLIHEATIPSTSAQMIEQSLQKSIDKPTK